MSCEMTQDYAPKVNIHAKERSGMTDPMLDCRPSRGAIMLVSA
jgi:hypothetical protein